MQLKLFPLTKRVLFHVITVLFSLMLIIVRKFSKDQVKKKKGVYGWWVFLVSKQKCFQFNYDWKIVYFYKLKTTMKFLQNKHEHSKKWKKKFQNNLCRKPWDFLASARPLPKPHRFLCCHRTYMLKVVGSSFRFYHYLL